MWHILTTETQQKHIPDIQRRERRSLLDKAILTYQRQSITGEIRKRRLVHQAISTFVL